MAPFETVKGCNEKFNLVVLDLTDPEAPALHRHPEEFFRMCQRLLNPDGTMTMPLGSPVFPASTVRRNGACLRRVFEPVASLTRYIPRYGSRWCLAVPGDTVNACALSPEVSRSECASAGSRTCTCASATPTCAPRASRCPRSSAISPARRLRPVRRSGPLPGARAAARG